MANTPVTPLTHLTATFDKATLATDGCLIKESLTVDEGVGTIIGSTVAGASFDSVRGFYSGDGTGKAAINFSEALGAGGLDICKTAFTLYMEIEKEAFKADLTITGILEHIFTWGVGAIKDHINLDPDNASGVKFRNQLSGANADTYTKGFRHIKSHIPVIITNNGGGHDVYINGYPTESQPLLKLAGSVTSFYINGPGTTSQPGLWKSAIRNVALWSRPFINPSSQGLAISSFGDSYAKNGTYPGSAGGGAINSETPDGLVASEDINGITAMDSGIFPVCHAALRQSGYGVMGNRINHWAAGGSGVVSTSANSATLGTRIDEAVLSKYPVPDYSVIVTGYNDLLNNTVSDSDLGDGTYAAAYQAEVDKLIAIGTVVIVCNLMWANGGATGITEARTTLINTAIAAVTGVTHIDMFAILGGFTNDKTNDGVHPDLEANVIYGAEISKVILSVHTG